jgi:pimeloyl-ACP methyl ester carboxylesterase
MSSTDKPVFVLAPGAWHTPDCFQTTQDELHAQGWETRAVTYPSVGAEPPNKGLFDDAAAVRAEIQTLADQGRQVIVVVHSYGGLVGAEAVKGLGYKQRKAEGKTGGVTLLVYLAAFVTPRGASILKMLGGQPLPWMSFQVSNFFAIRALRLGSWWLTNKLGRARYC